MEIITIWGTMARAGRGNKILFIIGSILFCACSLIIFRRLMKNPRGGSKN